MLEESIISIFGVCSVQNSIKLIIQNKSIPKQPKENYYGNREYKYKLTNINKLKLEKRATQCLFRLYEGNGKAIYIIGIDDNGNILGIDYNELLISLKNIKEILNIIDANVYKISIYKVNNKYCVVIKIKKQLIY